jgi:SAM-dependent methyltransferase
VDVASEYVGVDVVANPVAELLGPVEALPVADASFDVVLCTQVLEHADDPAQAVRELRRVTAPGGRVLASTHGVQVYHPSPVDYWRWTHTGLQRLFEENAEWSSVSVEPAAGTASGLAMLLGTFVEIALRRTALARPPVWLLNRLGAALDARSAMLRDPVPGSLIPNFHVVARV